MEEQGFQEDGIAQSSLSATAPPQERRHRQLSRSPHPYHRRGPGLLKPDAQCTDNSDTGRSPTPLWRRSPKGFSDSGTEADDESNGLLKGLPAPPVRPRKGLRDVGKDGTEGDVDASKLQPWPTFRKLKYRGSRRGSSEDAEGDDAAGQERLLKVGRMEVLRRVCETALVLAVGATVYIGNDVGSVAKSWNKELYTFAISVLGLYTIYPLRMLSRAVRRLGWRTVISFPFSPGFDPAPLIYPILLPILVSMSLMHHRQTLLLPNIMLSLSSLPPDVMPFHGVLHGYSLIHWTLTTAPFLISESCFLGKCPKKALALLGLNPETLFFIYPLHQALLPTLHFLTTTSLLATELQLLATGLVNLFLFSGSPQAEILKALIWLGSVSIFILCRHVLHWEVVLARVPSWMFRRSPSGKSLSKGFLSALDQKLCHKLSNARAVDDESSESDIQKSTVAARYSPSGRRQSSQVPGISDGISRVRTDAQHLHGTQEDPVRDNDSIDNQKELVNRRRHTFSTIDDVDLPVRTTPSGRLKRSMAPNLRAFLTLTAVQAQVRKWAYAIYVYAAVLFIILIPIRDYIGRYALGGKEPLGWAVGYLFGNIPSFRFWVLMANLEHWVRIPPRLDEASTASCHLGWMEHLRHDTFGEANTRLAICAYCLLVIITGLSIVLKLSSIVEVDTRRKVFHGMMVAMFLPTTYIDPTFAALALTLVLAIFLLLDLFRASQLPPISKPLTYFLAPYVDGRDHKGPVIVSHIFLLIGCAIPLWLSLAGTSRTGIAPWDGWDVDSRDLSMVSGVICVGMGDAAASLVGRRFGRRKWFWGGGKSLEGSVAFAVAVFAGLLAGRIWLVVGGWDSSMSLWSARQWTMTVVKSALAAAASSFTEAVLTGGNDNVVVPLVLWLLVRGLRI